jgi:hypothetical protein
MNLSLYLLLAPQSDSAKPVPVFPAAADSTQKSVTAVYNPRRPGSAMAKPLCQASRRQSVTASGLPHTANRLGFMARVAVDALGYLLMTSGLLGLLHIAQAGWA